MLLLARPGTGSQGGAAAEAIDFDGTNDYLSRASDLTGNADGKTFTFSAWLWLDSIAAGGQIIFGDVNSYLGVNVASSGINNFTLLFNNASNVAACRVTINDVLAEKSWTHFLLSVDLTNTSNRSMYVNGNLVAATFTHYVNDNIDFTRTTFGIGNRGDGGSSKIKSRLAHVFLDYTYRDLSVTANRRLFVTADLKPAAGQAALNPILYLPMSDPTQPGKNAGTGGDFTLTGVVARSGRGPNQYNAPYSDLDGSADYLNRTSIVGIADGKQFSFSCVFNSDSTDAGFMFNMRTTSLFNSFAVRLNTNNCLTVSAQNAAGTTILSVSTANNSIVAGRNYVITVSCDLTDTSKRWLYLNGEAVSVTWATYTNDTIDFTIPNYYVGLAVTPTSGIFNGRLGALWFNTSYIDLSQPANLAKFVTGTGIDAKPVDPGANGELPTGTSPLIYLPMYGNDAGRNYGTGGDFTVNSGPYAGARGPNEFWGNWAVMSNSPTGNNALRRTAGVVGVANSKTFTLSFVTNLTSRPSSSGFLYFIGSAGNIAFLVSFDTAATGALYITGRNSSGTIILSATVSNVFADGVQYSVQISVDLNNSANRSIYVNGVARTVTWDTYTNAFIELAFGGEVWVGRGAGANAINGRLSEFYFSTEYVDFSQEANRLKFRDAFGNPVNLTQQIEAAAIPTPAIYMRFPPTAFGTNSGTGGNFTVNGTITDGGQL